MLYLIIMAVLLIALVAGLFVAELPRERALIGAGWAGFTLVFTVIFAFNIVPAGHVGVVYTFGKITGRTGSGFVGVAPWKDVTVASVQTQKYSFHLDGFSAETQNVFVDATLNYEVAPADITGLYRNVGQGWFNVLVPTRINQAFKDETVKFKAVQIAPNRDQIRRDVLQRLKRDLSPFSIHVQDLNIDNISFSPAFTNAIEDKQIATQQAQAAQNRVATARYQAQQIIATAQGQAVANNLKRKTLTPLIVEQNAIDKLNPNVQVIVTNGNTLLPLSSNLFSAIGTTSQQPSTATAKGK